jgi:hypothetical protein
MVVKECRSARQGQQSRRKMKEKVRKRGRKTDTTNEKVKEKAEKIHHII